MTKSKTATLFLVAVLSLLAACSKKEEVATTEPKVPASAPSPKTKQEIEKEKQERKEEQKEKIDNHAKKTSSTTVDTSSIAGRKLGGLYSDLTGITGMVGVRHEIDFGELLADLWKRKLDRKKVSEATVKAADIPIARYVNEPKKMTLKAFVGDAEKEVARVKANLNFEAACKGYQLSQAECKMFRSLALDVRGVDLVAYGMTELMPSAEGDLNVKIMEILLRNAGSNYLFTIPALYDQMLSLGFYQFTSYAVNGSSGQGASKMNTFLPKEVRIPGSVIALKNGEHHRAAYLFALDNLANLAKRTNAKEFAALKKALKQKPADIVTFMATAHHAPGLALRCMKSWLSKGAKGSLNGHLVGRLKPYGKKSDNNLAALEKAL